MMVTIIYFFLLIISVIIFYSGSIGALELEATTGGDLLNTRIAIASLYFFLFYLISKVILTRFMLFKKNSGLMQLYGKGIIPICAIIFPFMTDEFPIQSIYSLWSMNVELAFLVLFVMAADLLNVIHKYISGTNYINNFKDFQAIKSNMQSEFDALVFYAVLIHLIFIGAILF